MIRIPVFDERLRETRTEKSKTIETDNKKQVFERASEIIDTKNHTETDKQRYTGKHRQSENRRDQEKHIWI